MQYAGYCLVGLIAMALGIWYYSEVGTEFIAVRSFSDAYSLTSRRVRWAAFG